MCLKAKQYQTQKASDRSSDISEAKSIKSRLLKAAYESKNQSKAREKDHA
jgi:hypothetical protein